MEYITINGELYHHGVKGQKWGVRRYQNKDGSLTPAGKKRIRNTTGRDDSNKIRYGSTSKTSIKSKADIDKEITTLKAENAANGKAAAGLALMGVGGLSVSALMLNSGFISPQLVAASVVSIGTGAGKAAQAAIGGVKVASLKAQLKKLDKNPNAETTPVDDKATSKEPVSKAPKVDKLQADSFTNRFKTNRYGDYESRISTKIGDADNIEVSVSSTKGKESESSAAAANFLKRYDLSKAKNGIVKEYYDGEYSWIDKDPSGDNYYSRSDFRSKIKPTNIDIDTEWNTYTVYWSDGGTYGGHVFVDEGSTVDMKVRRRSLEG